MPYLLKILSRKYLVSLYAISLSSEDVLNSWSTWMWACHEEEFSALPSSLWSLGAVVWTSPSSDSTGKVATIVDDVLRVRLLRVVLLLVVRVSSAGFSGRSLSCLFSERRVLVGRESSSDAASPFEDISSPCVFRALIWEAGDRTRACLLSAVDVHATSRSVQQSWTVKVLIPTYVRPTGDRKRSSCKEERQ